MSAPIKEDKESKLKFEVRTICTRIDVAREGKPSSTQGKGRCLGLHSYFNVLLLHHHPSQLLTHPKPRPIPRFQKPEVQHNHHKLPNSPLQLLHQANELPPRWIADWSFRQPEVERLLGLQISKLRGQICFDRRLACFGHSFHVGVYARVRLWRARAGGKRNLWRRKLWSKFGRRITFRSLAHERMHIKDQEGRFPPPPCSWRPLGPFHILPLCNVLWFELSDECFGGIENRFVRIYEMDNFLICIF